MTLSNSMLRSYLGQIAISYFAENDGMPEDLAAFDPGIEVIRRMAEASGDLPWLLLGLQHLVNQPGANLVSYAGTDYPLEANDVRAIIWRVLRVLNAPGGNDAPVVPITLENMTTAQWKEARAGLGTPPHAASGAELPAG